MGCCLEPLCTAGITHYHGKITLLYTLERYAQELLGTQRNIVLAVIGRLSVWTGIYAEHTEITGMTGPHPVVSLTSELTGRCRRSAHKPYVTIYLVYYDIALVSVIEVCNLHLTFGILLTQFGNEFINLILFHAGDIGHALQERYRKTGNGNLLLKTHCPVSVLQIVVIRC